jgi:hypothetical protein
MTWFDVVHGGQEAARIPFVKTVSCTTLPFGRRLTPEQMRVLDNVQI